jgi:hypothetical protein
MLVARDPHMAGQCVLAQVRNSLAELQPSLVYRITAADGALPRVDWLGSSPCSADDLLARPARTGHGPRDRAAVFLEQFLADGPRAVRDLWDAARKDGLSARTIQRAKEGLDIRCRRVYTDGQPVSYWLLPGQELATGNAADDEVARMLADLEKRFPAPTPLDDDFGR